jgi:MFS family permease
MTKKSDTHFEETETPVVSSNKFSQPKSVLIISMVMCAALYAVGCFVTAYIPSPWGFGQFRPAVIIPAFFAVIFGPMPAGVGAALGTLIADSLKHGYLYPGSYLAAVPGNFIGFFLFGYLLKKKFNWGRFVLTSNISLAVANVIVAFLYVFVFKSLYLGALELQLVDLSFLSIGLTIWWFVTMLPFVLIVTPPLIRAVAVAFPSVVPQDVKFHSLKQDLPRKAFSLSLLVPGLIMLFVGLLTTFTGVGSYLSTAVSGTAFVVIQTMCCISGVVLVCLGLLCYVGKGGILKKK